MKEIRAIIKAYKTVDFTATKAALATVVRVEGSSYRRTGARMLVLDTGLYIGGISGGCLEGDALRRAQKAIYKKKPSVITYDTTQNDAHAIGMGLGCNGIIDVLITPLCDKDEQNPVHILSEIAGTREPRIIVTVIGFEQDTDISGKMFLFENETLFEKVFPAKDIVSLLINDIEKCLLEHESKTVTCNTSNGAITVFIEVVMPATKLVLYGSNHDICVMASISATLGWDTIIVTNTSKANKELFETATQVFDMNADTDVLIDPYTAVVLMSHDYKTDYHNLQKILSASPSYIGLLGPRKRAEKMFNEMLKAGNEISEQDMERIYAPCGLDIGAATPEEISLSIVAEIKAHFTNRKGMSLKERQGTIYGN